MLSRCLRILTWASFVAIGQESALGAIVDVDSWRLITRAGDFVDGPGEMEMAEEPVTLPSTITRTLQSGDSISTSSYDFSPTPFGAVFHFEFNQVRDGDRQTGGRGDFALASGFVNFTLTAEARYRIDGTYELTGIPNGMELSVGLADAPVQGVILDSLQYDAGMPNQVFQVGGTAGSRGNHMVGSTSGALVPGEYLFAYVLSIYAVTPDDGASATGWLDLQIIPEPGVGVMAAAGAIVFLRRRI